MVLFEDLEDTQVSEAARETSAKGQADACSPGNGDCAFIPGLAHRLRVPRHARRIAGGASLSYGSHVPKERYFRTAMKTLPAFAPRA